MPKMLFYIIAEDQQIKHIAAQVQPPAMHKHRCQQGYIVLAWIRKEAGWDKCPLNNKSFTTPQLQIKNKEVKREDDISE